MLLNVRKVKNCRQSQFDNITISLITCRALKCLKNESQGKGWLFWTAETSSPDGKRGMIRSLKLIQNRRILASDCVATW